jgi:hypothetical protein
MGIGLPHIACTVAVALTDIDNASTVAKGNNNVLSIATQSGEMTVIVPKMVLAAPQQPLLRVGLGN